MNKSDKSSQERLPELDEILDAMGAAREMGEADFSGGNRMARQVEKLCTGETLEDVRQQCIQFRQSRDEATRAELAAQVFERLNAARELYVVNPAVGLPFSVTGA